MSKQIYISADYSSEDGDTAVVDTLHKWAKDNYHSVDFTDMAEVVSGSVCKDNSDCRPCELKAEFNRQINKSSIVVFVVGDKTSSRTAGSSCNRSGFFYYTNASCTPYKQNANGAKMCKNLILGFDSSSNDVNPVNSYSYLRHEFEQAKKKGKTIVIFYNSSRKETSWLPTYMQGYENNAIPFWDIDPNTISWKPNYQRVKKALGYE